MRRAPQTFGVLKEKNITLAAAPGDVLKMAKGREDGASTAATDDARGGLAGAVGMQERQAAGAKIGFPPASSKARGCSEATSGPLASTSTRSQPAATTSSADRDADGRPSANRTPAKPAAGTSSRPQHPQPHIAQQPAKHYLQSQVSLSSPDTSICRTGGTRARQRYDSLFAQKAIAEEYNTVVPAVRGAAAEEEALEQLALRMIAAQRAKWLALVIEDVKVSSAMSVAAGRAEEAALVPPGAEDPGPGGGVRGGAASGLTPIFPQIPGSGAHGGQRITQGSTTPWPLPSRQAAGGGGADWRATIGPGDPAFRPQGPAGAGQAATATASTASAAAGAGARAGATAGSFPAATVAVKGKGRAAKQAGECGLEVEKPPRLRMILGCCVAPQAR